MLSFWTTENPILSEVNRMNKELQRCDSPHQKVQTICEIIDMVFPQRRPSPLNSLFEETLAPKTNKLPAAFVRVVDLLSPRGAVGELLLELRDFRVMLQNFSLSDDMRQFIQTEVATQELNIRDTGSNHTIPLLEIFWVCLVNGLMSQKNQERANWDHFYQDEYRQVAAYNPIIIILRSWLSGSGDTAIISSRLFKISELLILRLPIVQLRRQTSIKVSQIHAAHMLLPYKGSPHYWGLAGALAEYLQGSNKYSSKLFHGWARLNLSLLTFGSNYERNLRASIEQAILDKRVTKGQLLISQTSVSFEGTVELIEEKSRRNLEWESSKILKQANWHTNPALLSAIYILMTLLRSPQPTQTQTSLSIFDRVFVQVRRHTKDKKGGELMKALIERFNELRGSEWQDLNPEKRPGERYSLGQKSRVSEGGQMMASLQSHQLKLSDWSRPLNKSKESYLVLSGALWVSRQVDTLLRRKASEDGYPRTNLRWVASWKWMLIMLLVVLAYMYLFKTL